MHITVVTKELKERLEVVARISSRHLTLPVLQCVLLDVSKNSLTLRSTNLEIGIEGTVTATVTKEGVVAVPAQTLLQSITFIEDTEVTLRVAESVLVVETKNATTEIKTNNSDEFPSLPRIQGNPQVIDKSLFIEGIKSVAFAASLSSIKPELGSILVTQKKEHTLTFVATDSFRLMEKTLSEKGIVFNDPILIPHKNAQEIARALESAEDKVDLYIEDNQCALSFGDLYITSRLTNSTFPDYEQIIPKEYETHTTLLTNDLMEVLKKTNIFLNKFMQLTISVSKTKLTLASESGDVGSTTETINTTTDGGDITLSFNQKYLSEALPHIHDESITLHFAGIGRPMVMEGVHDKTLRYLVMPMNK